MLSNVFWNSGNFFESIIGTDWLQFRVEFFLYLLACLFVKCDFLGVFFYTLALPAVAGQGDFGIGTISMELFV